MKPQTRLQTYPALEQWYRMQKPGTSIQSAERLVFQSCRAMDAPENRLAQLWIKAFREFLDESRDHMEDFLVADSMFADCGANLVNLLGEVGELALSTPLAATFQKIMEDAADLINFSVFRFLSAWSALNRGDMAKCAEECEKVDEPFSSIYALHGQALLELGKPREAIQVLSIAVKLSPTEIVAWFHLAKAHHVIDQFDAAWQALIQCKRLAPQSEEIALFMVMVANSGQPHLGRCEEAWNALAGHLPHYTDNETVVTNLMMLACHLGTKERAKYVAESGNWTALSSQPRFTKNLGPLLRALHDRQWLDIAQAVLASLTAPA